MSAVARECCRCHEVKLTREFHGRARTCRDCAAVRDAPALPESAWQEQVVQLAQLYGWRHLHVRRSIGKGHKWVTATNCDGWPDLFLWNVRRPERGLIAIELKAEDGDPTDEQIEVLAQLAASGVRTMIARPSDLDAVHELLRT